MRLWRARSLVGATLLGVVLVAGCSGDAGSEKLQTIRDLGEGGDHGADKLAEMASSEDLLAANEAAWALSRSRSSKARQGLERVISDEKNQSQVRKTAVMALSERKEPESKEFLMRVARFDPSAEVRAEAIAAVGRIGTLDDVEPILDVAVTDKSLLVQSRAVAVVERLLHRKFKYRSGGPPKERQEALDRIQSQAIHLVESQKRLNALLEAGQ